MFGHQDDIITQDQKRDVDVTIPESALDALTGLSDSSTASDDSTLQPPEPPAPAPTPTPTAPGLAPTSIDGFAAPNAKLSTPFSYMQNNSSDDADAASQTTSDTDKPEEASEDAAPEDTSVDSLLSPSEPDHDEGKAAAEYLDNLIANNPRQNSQSEEAPEVSSDDATEDQDEPETSESIVEPAQPELPPNADHLLSIKQEALNELSPLVGQLNLEPEEKFNTIMMLIRASDNETLLGDAYAAARAITDEKTRAQALLDVVNEINYFTGHEAVAA